MPQKHVIQKGVPEDAEAIAEAYRAIRAACHPYLPVLRTADEDVAFFSRHLSLGADIWVAKAVTIDGFCAFREGWVDMLYVRPRYHGRGLGSALLARAMAASPSLRLWVFQRNEQAIRFYLARGFREIGRTDGGGNEEREPDVLLEWTRQG